MPLYRARYSSNNKNAALLVEDSQASCKLVDNLLDLLENKEVQKELGSNIQKIAVKDAAIQIADIAIGLIKK